MGKPVIMGRKTWESLPGPLEGRTNIVMSENLSYMPEGARVARSTFAAVEIAESEGYEACVIGGEAVFKRFLYYTQIRRIHLTVVDSNFKGDTYFPLDLLDGRPWTEVSRDEDSYFWGDSTTHTYYELVEKRQPGEGVHEIWHWVDRKAYEEATGR